jgi:hypothetical protein
MSVRRLTAVFGAIACTLFFILFSSLVPAEPVLSICSACQSEGCGQEECEQSLDEPTSLTENCGLGCKCILTEFVEGEGLEHDETGAFGAEFAVDANCDDNSPDNLDSCSEYCARVQEPVCGNDGIDPGEECELPNTSGNAYIIQGKQEGWV